MAVPENADHSEPQLQVSRNKMVVFLVWDSLPKELDSLAERLHVELRELGIQSPPGPEEIVNSLSDVLEKSHFLKRIPLVTGTPVRPCQHGRTDWTSNYFDSGLVADPETGRVDYRRQAALRSVVKGELLGCQTFSRAGVEGQDVFGEVVSPEEPRNFHPKAGKHVRFEREAAEYYSEVDGRVRLTDGVLSVDDLQTIQGSVGLKTGNVKHPGAILVKEDVRAGSRIEAEGDIEILGVVEAASVVTSGDLIIRGGVTSSGEERIEAGGSVHTKYLLDASLIAGRDVVVEAEIVNSTVITYGSLNMPLGRIVGGTVIALRGIHVGQVGSPAAVPTILIVGEHPDHLMEAHQRAERIIKALTVQLEQNSDDAAPGVIHLKEQLAAITKQLHGVEQFIKDRSSFCVDVEKSLYQGALIQMGSERLAITDDRSGKFHFVLEDGQIVS